MRVRTLCTQRHSLRNTTLGAVAAATGREGRDDEDGGRWMRGAVTSRGGGGVAIRTYVEQVQQHRGDFIEACIWASLMHACTPQTYKHGYRETDRQVDRKWSLVCVRSPLLAIFFVVVVVVVVVTRIVNTAMRRGAEVSPLAVARETPSYCFVSEERRKVVAQKEGGQGWSSRAESRITRTNSRSLKK